ncbi:Hydrocephalus-inducing protein-like protein [Frankliniella fusca]|uniref:Hydrocephalus-inducing protein-like protein n=1 Tax=Frankliniella fusca TaxID=407009 RepID=A0AAE1H1H5_9NEOP|nr:Hydrocephalus-inducing protein-like protein [Frankliniella fusca]
MKEYYDRTASLAPFKEGDKVYLNYLRRKKGISTKLLMRWGGPYVILNILNDCNARIKNLENNKVVIVHIDRLAKCPEGDENKHTDLTSAWLSSGEQSQAEDQARKHKRSREKARKSKALQSLKGKISKSKGNAIKPKVKKVLQAEQKEVSLDDTFRAMIIIVEPVTEIEDPEEITEIKSEAEVAEACKKEESKKEESKTVVFFKLVDDFSVTDNGSDEGERSEKSKQQEAVNVKQLEAGRQETSTDEEEKEERKWKLIKIEEVTEAKGRKEWLGRVTKRCRKCKKRSFSPAKTAEDVFKCPKQVSWPKHLAAGRARLNWLGSPERPVELKRPPEATVSKRRREEPGSVELREKKGRLALERELLRREVLERKRKIATEEKEKKRAEEAALREKARTQAVERARHEERARLEERARQKERKKARQEEKKKARGSNSKQPEECQVATSHSTAEDKEDDGENSDTASSASPSSASVASSLKVEKDHVSFNMSLDAFGKIMEATKRKQRKRSCSSGDGGGDKAKRERTKIDEGYGDVQACRRLGYRVANRTACGQGWKRERN